MARVTGPGQAGAAYAINTVSGARRRSTTDNGSPRGGGTNFTTVTGAGLAGSASAINLSSGSGTSRTAELTGAGLAGDAYAINRTQQKPSSSAGRTSTFVDLADPKTSRNAVNGINTQTKTKNSAGDTNTVVQSVANSGDQPVPIENDWRIRIGLGKSASFFYRTTETNIMTPLKETDGVIFPYTPKITVTHVANYSPAAMVHSNYHQQFFSDSQVSDIVISGDFTAQSIDEGQYLLAVIYFFRSATKMFFGQGENAGNPPPLVFLNGYGDQYFPNVPCVITNFSQDMPDDVDYIEVPTTNGASSEREVEVRQQPQTRFVTNPNTGQREAVPAINQSTRRTKELVKELVINKTWVPASTRLSVTLRPVYSRQNLANNFNLNDFAAGRLLGRDGLGGFI